MRLLKRRPFSIFAPGNLASRANRARQMPDRRATPRTGRLATWIPFLWLLVFFLVPFLIVARISLSQTAIAMPPYQPVFDSLAAVREGIGQLSFENYRWIFGDALYVKAYLSSVVIAGASTLIAFALGFPIAYGMARAPRTLRPALVTLVILPFWTSFLIRVYAWIGILRPEGFLNQALMGLGVTSDPLALMN